MKLHRTATFIVLLTVLSVSSLTAAGQWLHLHVQEGGEETLSLNVPVTLVSTLLPFVQDKAMKHARGIDLGDGELGVAEMRELWTALKSSGSGELANVRTSDADVHVRLDEEYLMVDAREGETEKAHVRVPTPVVDALLSGSGEELDVMAALEALTSLGSTDLVEVEADATRVRLWVD